MKDKLIKVKQDIILDAAKHLFFHKGYENTYVEEIAQEAGISKSTLYEYFKSKQELLIRIFVNIIVETHEQYVEAIGKKTTGFEKLREYSLAIYTCYKNNPQYLNLFDEALRNAKKISEFSLDIKEKYENSHNATKNLLRSIFEIGVEDGSLRQDLDIDLSINYFGITIQHIVKLFIFNQNYTMDDYRTAIEYFLNGFVFK